MNSNMTYENLLGTCGNFEAYLLAVAKKFDDDLWVKTKSKHTVQAYKYYLNTLPNGIHKQDAQTNISKIKSQQEEDEAAKERKKQQLELEKQIKFDEDSWLKAHKEKTLQAYEQYLNTLPNGIHRQEAIERIDNIKRKKEERSENERQKALQKHEREKQLMFDEDLWLDAKNKNTKDAYEYYLNTLPNGIHKREAEACIKEIKEESEQGFYSNIISVLVIIFSAMITMLFFGKTIGLVGFVFFLVLALSISILLDKAKSFFQSSRR